MFHEHRDVRADGLVQHGGILKDLVAWFKCQKARAIARKKRAEDLEPAICCERGGCEKQRRSG
jgi:hypothetical protein